MLTLDQYFEIDRFERYQEYRNRIKQIDQANDLQVDTVFFSVNGQSNFSEEGFDDYME